jgi:DNA-binding response OmpR family regulator
MGRRILIVEDEMTIAMMIEDMILELGHEPYAIASRLGTALGIAESGEFDLAILDVNLDGHVSTPVARALAARRIPFFFATGYGAAGVDPDFADALVVNKPFVIGDIAVAIEATLADRA